MPQITPRRIRTTAIPAGVNITGCTDYPEGFVVVDSYNKRLV